MPESPATPVVGTEGLGRIASREEVRRAILALTPAEAACLERYARNRAGRMGGDPQHDWEDLLQTAKERLLSTRSWPSAVPFYVVLMGAMKSLSSNEHRKSERWGPMPEREDLLPFTDPRRKEEAAKDRLERLISDCSDDPDALLVLGHHLDRLPGPQIKEALDLTENRYRAIMRRIHRRYSAITKRT